MKENIERYNVLQKYINDNFNTPFFLDENGITYNVIGAIIREYLDREITRII